MKKQVASSSFNKGLMMDLNPIMTPNDVLTNCLNGTLLTYNGNEYSLQNDMGNGRVETAHLPEGYIPLGTTELGGIIYIVSYNPFTKKAQVGSFPSPERNISSDELNDKGVGLNIRNFYDEEGFIITPYQKIELLDRELNPGDKFKIYTSSSLSNSDSINNKFTNKISAFSNKEKNPDLDPSWIKLSIVSIQDGGTLYDLTKNIEWIFNNYYIQSSVKSESDVLKDEYTKGKPNYQVFNSKVSGKLGILAKLEVIDYFDITWDASLNSQDKWQFTFYTNWTYDNLSKDRYKVNPNGLYINYSIIDPTIDNSIINISLNTDIKRKNDGTDEDVIVNWDKSFDKNNDIVEFIVYPQMPFGPIKYLGKKFSIDIFKLGSGAINLIEYRYLVNDNLVTLNWGLDTYLEKNKSIEKISFEFFEFNKDLYDRIKENNIYFNENKINDRTLLDSPKATYTVNKRTSYSGYHTSNINLDVLNLNKDSLYVVQMVINYSGVNKYFYRLMYTSDIFNDEYYNPDCTDYAKINLNEVINKKRLELELNVTDVIQNSESGLYEGEEKIANISKYISADSDKKEFDYYTKYIYNNTVNYEISFKQTLNPFKFQINSKADGTENFTSDVELLTSTNDAEKQELTNDFNKQLSNNLDSVSIESEFSEKINNTFTFKSTIKSPIKVFYNKTTVLPITYELVPITIDSSYLIYDGGDKYHGIFLTDDINSEYKNQTLGEIDHYGNNKRIREAIEGYPRLYAKLKQKLQKCDILVLMFRTSNLAYDDKYTNWGWGTFGLVNWNPRIEYTADDKTGRSAMFLLYAVKDEDGEVILFTYGTKNRNKFKNSTCSFGPLIALPDSSSNDDTFSSKPAYNSYIRPYAFNSSQFTEYNSDIEYPIKGYYKCINYIGPGESRNEYSNIQYYNDYTVSIPVKVNTSVNYDVLINNIKLTDNSVNNLRVDSIQDFTHTYIIKEKINNSQYINNLVSISNNPILTKTTDYYGVSEIKEFFDLDPSIMYTWDGNKLNYLKGCDGNLYYKLTEIGKDPDKNFEDFNDNKIPIKSSNNTLVIQKSRSTIGKGNKANAHGREEGQGVSITDIWVIND